MQYVKLDLNGSAYTYGWTGDDPLEPGDWVWCPGNSVHPDTFEARVLRVLSGPDYDGPITTILSRSLL
jgi:hypothetical protein